MLVGIAWRNIWRNKKRSAVLLVAIALGLCGGLFATGVMVGMAESMVNTAIDRELGHLQIHTTSFKTNPAINDFIPGGDSIAASLLSIEGVTGVSARTVIEGMASSPVTNTGVKIEGVVPKGESSVTTISKAIVDGEYLNDVGRYPVIIGRKLADKLDVRVRSKLVLSFPGRDGGIIYGSFRIVGLFESGSSVIDKATVMVRRDDLATLLGSESLVHEIALRLQNAQSLPRVTGSLKLKYAGLAVESWKQLAPELKLTSETTNISMLFFLGIILFGLLFGITNTMLMSVLDRVREFGVLMAIGMKRKRIFTLIILETMFLALSGGVAGVTLGALAVGITKATGINLSVVSEGLLNYGIASMLYPDVPLILYFELGVLVVITALFAAIYPGVKATKLNPAKSIRTYA
jgi:putative ABC transport system permease protein